MPPREETPMDQAVFDSTLQAELAKGTDRRVAEGRARAAGVRAYRKAHGEPEREAKSAAERQHAAASGDGEAAAAAAPAAAPAAVPAAAVAVPAGAVGFVPAPAAPRVAPPPTGRVPTPKPGAPDKHRLLALVPPEGVQRVEREQGDRINVFPHLLLEELISLLVMSVFLIAFVGASIGGSLVYDYGFNVENAASTPVWKPSEVDLMPGQSKEP